MTNQDKKNNIIDGKLLADKIKDEIVREIVQINYGLEKAAWQRPNLAIILIGDREDSRLYVEMKEREAKRVGIDTHIYRCAADTPEREIFEMIDYLNKDELIDAILIQLPLPDGFDTDGLILAIDPAKDVDGFHPDNTEIILKYCENEQTCPPELQRRRVMPPVLASVLEMLKSINCDLAGKQACVIANSDIFGQSLAKVLECRGAKTIISKADDEDLKNKTKKVDILISAVGRKNLISAEAVKSGAIVIDIGITKEGKKICGDIDFENVKKIAGYITPVPGGVGPMTIAMLFKNTLELYKHGKKNHPRADFVRADDTKY